MGALFFIKAGLCEWMFPVYFVCPSIAADNAKGVFSPLCRLLFHFVSSKRRGFQLIKAAFTLLHAVYWKRSRFMVAAQSSVDEKVVAGDFATSIIWRIALVPGARLSPSLSVFAVFLCCTEPPSSFCARRQAGRNQTEIFYMYLTCAIFLSLRSLLFYVTRRDRPWTII
jgi:hypothetical protein